MRLALFGVLGYLKIKRKYREEKKPAGSVRFERFLQKPKLRIQKENEFTRTTVYSSIRKRNRKFTSCYYDLVVNLKARIFIIIIIESP